MAKRDYWAMAQMYMKGKAMAKAERCLKVLLRHDPKHANAWFVLGIIWMEKGGWALAKDCFETALTCPTPDHRLLNAARNNLSIAYRRLDRTSEALGKFHEALGEHIDPNILSNIGSCNLDIGNWRDAERNLRRATVLAVGHNDANWNLALSLLTQRKWPEAWSLHDWGFRAKERGLRPYLDHWPMWRGESLEGKTLLLWGEQGIGDEILFAGTFEDLRKRGAKEVIYDCHPRMEKIFKRSFPWMRIYGRRKDQDVGAMVYARAAAKLSGLNHLEIARVVQMAGEQKAPFDGVMPREDGKGWHRLHELPIEQQIALKKQVKQDEVFFRWNIDYQFPVGSLPTYFRQRDEDFLNAKYDFLKADMGRVQHFLQKYPSDRLRVGLCWLGGSRKTAIHRRSIPLEKFADILKLPATWISLQYGDVGYEVQQVNNRFGVNLIHDDTAIEDLDDLAALTASCDLVISVIQTQVHMAGALGVETWCLACNAPPWKFHDAADERDTLLWHPAVRMIRQGKGDKWPLEDIRSLLASRLKATKPTEKTSLLVFGNSGRPVSELSVT